jgi:YbbR domain-containing protein
MAAGRSSFQPGYALLALMISAVLWGMSHTSSQIDRGFDIPVVFHGLPDNLVLTSQSTQVVNIRVLGPRAALREISPTEMEYPVNVEGARVGAAVYQVDESLLELSDGVRIISRSPSVIDVTFESRGRKSVRVNVEVSGEPAPGFAIGGIEIEPPRVWLAGARRDVLALSEVSTETIEVTGMDAPIEREIRLALAGGHVWLDEDQPVKVRIQIDPIEGPEVEGEISP